MSTFNNITCLTALALLLQSSLPVNAQHTVAHTFRLPASRQTGLVNTSFNITTSFKVTTIAGNKEADLVLKMDVAAGTAQQPKPAFEYRYMYHGEVFTDQDVGPAPFYKIRPWLVEFNVIVQGNGDTWEFQLSKADKTKVLKVPLGSKASEYRAVITGMTFIQFEGYQEIENAIRKILEKRKTAASPQGNNNPLKSASPAATTSSPTAAKKETTNDKRTTTPPAIAAGGPALVEKDGKYYIKDANGNYTETTKQAYDVLKVASKPSTSATPAPTTPQVDYYKQFQEGQNKYFDQVKASHARIEQESALMMNSFYAAQAVKQAKNNLQSLSRLEGNYESLEELNADFESKYYAINEAVEELTSARQQNLQASYDNLYQNASETNRAIGQALVTAGSIASEMAAEKKRRQMQEELRRQRAAEEARIKERKWQALLTMRKEMLKRFPDGGVPLSFHKVGTDNLYFFAYVLDTTDVAQQSPVAMLTNVFPVSRYADSTWPFKNNITGDLKKITGSGKITIMGYYTTEKLASDMRTAFMNIAEKCQIGLKHYTYKGRKSTASSSNADFWEIGQQNTKKPAPAEDDFWEIGNTGKKPANAAKER